MDARLANDRHEIGITTPAREKVKVKVIRHARAGAPAEVHAQVVPFRVVGSLQSGLDISGQLHHLPQGFRFEFGKGSHVEVRSYQGMASRVGKQIQEDEIAPGAMEDKVLPVV